MANVRAFHLIITITLQNKNYLHLLSRKVKSLFSGKAAGGNARANQTCQPPMSVPSSPVTGTPLHPTPHSPVPLSRVCFLATRFHQS